MKITGTNDAAVISGDTAKSLTQSDEVLTTSGALSATDADSATTFVAQTGAAGSGGYGKFSIGADGAWTYTANTAHNEFVKDQVYTDTLTVKTADGTSQVITVKITGTNDAAVISGDTAKSLTQSDEVLTTSGALSATDADSATTFVAQTGAAGSGGYGKFSIGADGAWTYTANTAHNEFVKDQVYTDTLTVKTADGTSQVITVKITGTNDAAVISGDTAKSLTQSDEVLTTSGALSATDADSATTFVAQTGAAGSGGYGKFSIGADGAWTYTANTAHNEFVKDQVYTDTLTVKTADGTSQVITVKITGTNDAAVISGDTAKSLTQSDEVLTTSGALSATDADSATTFVAQTGAAGSGGYGKFSIGADGAWTYTANTAHNEFVKDQVYTDTLTVKTADGTSQVITVKITGTNDAAFIGTPTVAAVTEDTNSNDSGDLIVTGSISISDADTGQASFSTTVTSADGNLGSLELAADGNYTYTLANSKVQYLGAGDTKTETFTVTSADGTSKELSFTVNGTDDAPVLNIRSSTRDIDENANNNGRIIAFNGSANDLNVASGTATSTQHLQLSDVDTADFGGHTLKISVTSGNMDQLRLGVSGSNGVFKIDSDDGEVHYYSDATYDGETGVNVTAHDPNNSAADIVIGHIDSTHKGSHGDSLWIHLNDKATTEITQALASKIFLGVTKANDNSVTQDWSAASGEKTVKFEIVGSTDAVLTSAERTVNIVSHADALSRTIEAKTYGQGETITVTVTADDLVYVNAANGTPYYVISIGGIIKNATYTSGSGTKQLTYTYVVEAGLSDANGIDLVRHETNGAVIKDDSGSALNSGTSNINVHLDGVLVDTNHAPTVSAELTASTTEGSNTATSLNLLDNASDVDRDTLSVSAVRYKIGTTDASSEIPAGLSLSDGVLTVNPKNAAFNHLSDGEPETITVSYKISDGHGGTVEQTATVTITGKSQKVSITYSEAVQLLTDRTYYSADDVVTLNINASDVPADRITAIANLKTLGVDFVDIGGDGKFHITAEEADAFQAANIAFVDGDTISLDLTPAELFGADDSSQSAGSYLNGSLAAAVSGATGLGLADLHTLGVDFIDIGGSDVNAKLHIRADDAKAMDAASLAFATADTITLDLTAGEVFGTDDSSQGVGSYLNGSLAAAVSGATGLGLADLHTLGVDLIDIGGSDVSAKLHISTNDAKAVHNNDLGFASNDQIVLDIDPESINSDGSASGSYLNGTLDDAIYSSTGLHLTDLQKLGVDLIDIGGSDTAATLHISAADAKAMKDAGLHFATADHIATDGADYSTSGAKASAATAAAVKPASMLGDALSLQSLATDQLEVHSGVMVTLNQDTDFALGADHSLNDLLIALGDSGIVSGDLSDSQDFVTSVAVGADADIAINDSMVKALLDAGMLSVDKASTIEVDTDSEHMSTSLLQLVDIGTDKVVTSQDKADVDLGDVSDLGQLSNLLSSLLEDSADTNLSTLFVHQTDGESVNEVGLVLTADQASLATEIEGNSNLLAQLTHVGITELLVATDDGVKGDVQMLGHEFHKQPIA